MVRKTYANVTLRDGRRELIRVLRYRGMQDVTLRDAASFPGPAA